VSKWCNERIPTPNSIALPARQRTWQLDAHQFGQHGCAGGSQVHVRARCHVPEAAQEQWRVLCRQFTLELQGKKE
jgi:hypothetical protein